MLYLVAYLKFESVLICLRAMIVVDNKEGFDMGQNRKVDLKCANASNPYHICTDYCFQKMHEKDQLERGKPGMLHSQMVFLAISCLIINFVYSV